MRVSPLPSVVLLSLTGSAIGVVAHQLQPQAGNAGNSIARRGAAAAAGIAPTLVPHDGVLPVPSAAVAGLARRHAGGAGGGAELHHGRHALKKRQQAVDPSASDSAASGSAAPSDAVISPDGQTASMPDPGQSSADGAGEDYLPPECEAACTPFNNVITQCGASENADDVSCECQSSTMQAFVDCSTCAPALYENYRGGLRGFVTGAIEECKQAGVTVDFDTSSLPGSGDTGYTGPSDDELSASAASASSALAAAGGSVSEITPTDDPKTASPTTSSGSAGRSNTATGSTTSSPSRNETAAASDSGKACTGRQVEGTVAAAGLAAIALAAFAGVL